MASVATVYSKALYSIAKEEKIVDRVGADLKEFYDICRASADLRKVLFGALFDANTRAAVATEVATKLKAQAAAVKFFALIARKNRVSELGAIINEYNKIKDREQGSVRGELRAAVELPMTEVEGLASSLSKRVGKRVELFVNRDDSLLGGFVVTVDGKTFDSSLRTQLRKLKEICTA